jgi:hypothetical protein
MPHSFENYYRKLVKKHGWQRVAPLLEVLPELEAEIGRHGLHKFKSHEILRITPNFQDPFKDDIISIFPDECGMARVFFQKKEDADKVMVLFGKGGVLVEYKKLVSTLSPHFKKLAEKGACPTPPATGGRES